MIFDGVEMVQYGDSVEEN